MRIRKPRVQLVASPRGTALDKDRVDFSDSHPSSCLRVFLASPGDVTDERALVRKVLDDLSYDPLLNGRITFQVIAWDRPGGRTPMLATMTPQEAIARHLLKPSECDIVVTIFWSRMGTPLPRKFTKPNGSRYESGTEWEFHDALQANRRFNRPQILLYRRTGAPRIDASDPEYVKKGLQWKKVEKFFASFRNPDGSLQCGHNAYATPEEFRQQVDQHLRTLVHEFLKTRDSQSDATPQPPLWRGSPFPGLRAFTPEDAPIFFGRGLETDGLIKRLADPSNRFVAVVGASGSGKSSLVAAGLLPRLQNNALAGSKDWRWTRFKPGELGDNPLLALASGLAPHLQHLGRRTSELADELNQRPSAITELVHAALRGTPDWAEMLLFVDQFEELFTLAKPSFRDRFFSSLKLVSQAPRTRTVVTLRSDFYARCAESAELAELLRDGSYPLAAPGVGALFEMISKPAERAGLAFDDGLVVRIVNDTGAEPGNLTLMAFALSELYETRATHERLTHASYERFNGVQGAIGRRAEDTFCSLDPSVQSALGRVFQELVEVNEDGIGGRRRAPLSRFRGEAESLLETLTGARLLVKSGAEQREPVVEVAHEALLTSWPRLTEWIRNKSEDLRLLRQVRSAAAEWDRNKRKPEYLWPDQRMMQVWAMVDTLQPELNDTERCFVRPFDRNELMGEIDDPRTSHERRVSIGDYLAKNGDARPGVGLDTEGLPDLVWCEVTAGEVRLEGVDGAFRVDRFEISKYLVTWIQYRAFVEAPDGYQNPEWWKLLDSDNGPGTQYRPLDDHPAENLSWRDAVAFCRWLSARRGYEVRLPTEWEWQQAAGGGLDDREFPWGDDWTSSKANTAEGGLNRTTAVGLYGQQSASPVGALDLSGNVWEWCLNEYLTPDRVDLTGDRPRAVRGGSFFYKLESARVKQRDRDLPTWRNLGHGFRLARCPVAVA
jgi:Sulfatase-modifying factor enzyme 1